MKIVFWILIVSGTVYCFTKSVKHALQVTAGLALFEAYNALYDICLWPIVQGYFGGAGAIALTVTALILNFIMLKWYQKCQVDWLGITVTDQIIKKSERVRMAYAVSEGPRRLKLALPRYFFLIAEKAITIRIIPFLVLSVYQDSFVATAFFLHRKNGSVKTGLKGEDYVVFILSTLFSCVVWTLFTEWITLPAFKNVWQTFTG